MRSVDVNTFLNRSIDPKEIQMLDRETLNKANADRVAMLVDAYMDQIDTTVEDHSVQSAVSDFITDLAHYARLEGACVTDVFVKAIRNFAEEISDSDAWLDDTGLLAEVEESTKAIISKAEQVYADPSLI